MTESVDGASLAFQSINDVEGCDRLSSCVFGISNGITQYVLEKRFQHTSRLLVDEPANTLDTTSPGQTSDGGLRDPLDSLSKNLPMALSAFLTHCKIRIPSELVPLLCLRRRHLAAYSDDV